MGDGESPEARGGGGQGTARGQGLARDEHDLSSEPLASGFPLLDCGWVRARGRVRLGLGPGLG